MSVLDSPRDAAEGKQLSWQFTKTSMSMFTEYMTEYTKSYAGRNRGEMRYIDAEQLKQAILARYVPILNHSINQYDRGRADAQDEVLDLINAMCKEDLSTGEWVQIRCYDTKSVATYMCSECGRKITSGMANPEKSYPYCHCGARMGEREGKMITSIMLSDEEKARLKRCYIDQLWNFVRKTGAEVETENDRLWLIINADQVDAFCDTFCVDDDVINLKIKGRKLYIEARWLVPYAKDSEILAEFNAFGNQGKRG